MFNFNRKNGDERHYIVIHKDDIDSAMSIIQNSEAINVDVEDPHWANAEYARIVRFNNSQLDFARVCHKINSEKIRTYSYTIGY